ncbi:putative protein-serine/threonine phosphatase [Helianthus debilis subsp. tardiflorus]
MPSFKMKTKSSGDFTRETNGLHVCQKSSKISKNSFTHTRNLQHESELDTRTTPNVQDDSFCNKADERTNCCQMVDGDNIQIQKHISPSSAMDHTETCSSTIETIFSPILDSIDIEPNIYDYGDMFIPDMIVSSSRLLDYEYDESSRFFGDECLLLPFLEDNIQTENRYVDGSMFIRNLIDLSEISTSSHHSRTKSITLALDLDETLVHSSLEHCDDADFTFSVFSSLKEHTVYVKQRPYLRTFLEKVSEMFHIVIFTASQSIYAKKLLDILDPDGTIISRRAYRDSCIFADGSYTKDLTVLGVDLAKIVIIDNSPQVFRLQVNNGIPIKSWFDDPSDCALISLLPFLESLVDAQDVRPIIAKRFGNKE